jgi:hypothetical protein
LSYENRFPSHYDDDHQERALDEEVATLGVAERPENMKVAVATLMTEEHMIYPQSWSGCNYG